MIALIAAFLLAPASVAAGNMAASDPCAPYAVPTKGVLPRPPGAEIYKRVGNAYVTASSYSDEGEIAVELKSPGAEAYIERGTFRTRFQRPRKFLFDFHKNGAGEAFVIWSPDVRFNIWWSATGVLEKHREGEGAHAFGVAAAPTMTAVLAIAAMLFWDSRLEGPVRSMKEPSLVGYEAIDGQCHYKISARVRLNHWSDADRLTTLSVGVKDYLVRKIVEETPSNAARGQVEKTTVRLNPSVNLTIAPRDFQFVPEDADQ